MQDSLTEGGNLADLREAAPPPILVPDRKSVPPRTARSRGIGSFAGPLLVVAFFLISGALVASWTRHGAVLFTGDEPHYLVLSRAMGHGNWFDLQREYLHEFGQPEFWAGWPSPSALFDPAQAHLVRSDSGFFSIHGLGLPLILAVPVWLAGPLGARVTMLLIATAFVALIWWATGRISQRSSVRVLATVGATFSMPFLVAAGQVYPDIPGGVVFLGGLLALGSRNPRRRYVVFLAVALLPWLQIKFVALGAVLFVAAVIRWRQDRTSIARLCLAAVPVLVSATGLAAYNLHMIGSLHPYQYDGAQAFDIPAIERLIGLIADQNQGLLFASPVLLLGIPGIVLLIRRDWLVGIATGLGCASILLLNAMHTNPYGGGSMSGRFGWTAAVVIAFPTCVLLARLGSRSIWALSVVTALSGAYQGLALARYANVGTVPTLFNKSVHTPLFGYGNIFTEFSNLLPAWYAPDWAAASVRNWAWVVAATAVLACGVWVVLARRRSVTIVGVLASCLAMAISAVVVVRAEVPDASQRAAYPAAVLGGSTGLVAGSGRVARGGVDSPGLLAYGPWEVGQIGLHLEQGRYLATFQLSEVADSSAPIGEVIAVAGVRRKRVIARARVGRGAREATVALRLDTPTLVAFKFVWDGGVDVGLRALLVRRTGSL